MGRRSILLLVVLAILALSLQITGVSSDSTATTEQRDTATTTNSADYKSCWGFKCQSNSDCCGGNWSPGYINCQGWGSDHWCCPNYCLTNSDCCWFQSCNWGKCVNNSPSPTPSTSFTSTRSITSSKSVSSSKTPTHSVTPSKSPTPTKSLTSTATASISRSKSMTSSKSVTSSTTSTASKSPSVSTTSTASKTPSISTTSTATSVPSVSLTPSLSVTRVPSVSLTPSLSFSSVASESLPASVSASITSLPSASLTSIPSLSLPASLSLTNIPSLSLPPSLSLAPSESESESQSFSVSPTTTESAAPIPSQTVCPLFELDYYERIYQSENGEAAIDPNGYPGMAEAEQAGCPAVVHYLQGEVGNERDCPSKAYECARLTFSIACPRRGAYRTFDLDHFENGTWRCTSFYPGLFANALSPAPDVDFEVLYNYFKGSPMEYSEYTYEDYYQDRSEK